MHATIVVVPDAINQDNWAFHSPGAMTWIRTPEDQRSAALKRLNQPNMTRSRSEQEYETHRVPAGFPSQPGRGEFRQTLLSQALHFTIDGYMEGMSSCKHFPSPTALEAVVAMMPTAIVLAA